MKAHGLAFQFVLVLAAALKMAGGPTAPPQNAPVVVQIPLTGMIEPITAEYVEHGIRHAARIHAQAILLELSTPGGLGTSMRGIIQSILNSPVPVITYVYPSGARAASAGFFILLSADVAVMAPGTNAGAAHPVLLGGGSVGKTEGAKIENDAAAYIRTLAGERGRNVKLAEAGVRKSASYTDSEALKGGLIDAVASSPQAIFQEFNGRTIKRINGKSVTLRLADARIEAYNMTSRQRLLAHLADPNIAFVLAAIGAILLYFEFTHPGMVLPGVVGAMAIVLALFGFYLLPINYVGVILIVLALVLFGLEAHVGSHGWLAAGGIVAMFLGSMVLIKSPWPGTHIHWSISLSVTVPLAVITTLLLRAAILARRRKSISGAEGLLDSTGVARTDVAPLGKIMVRGEIWDARATESIPAGTPVRVRAVEGLMLVVEPRSKAS